MVGPPHLIGSIAVALATSYALSISHGALSVAVALSATTCQLFVKGNTRLESAMRLWLAWITGCVLTNGTTWITFSAFTTAMFDVFAVATIIITLLASVTENALFSMTAESMSVLTLTSHLLFHPTPPTQDLFGLLTASVLYTLNICCWLVLRDAHEIAIPNKRSVPIRKDTCCWLWVSSTPLFGCNHVFTMLATPLACIAAFGHVVTDECNGGEVV